MHAAAGGAGAPETAAGKIIRAHLAICSVCFSRPLNCIRPPLMQPLFSRKLRHFNLLSVRRSCPACHWTSSNSWPLRFAPKQPQFYLHSSNCCCASRRWQSKVGKTIAKRRRRRRRRRKTIANCLLCSLRCLVSLMSFLPVALLTV